MATPGPVLTRVDRDGKPFKVKVYRGMASGASQNEHHGGMAEWKTAEGISIEIPYRETENDIIADIIDGLRSGLTYGGAANIRELQRKLDYIQISWVGRIEGLAHIAPTSLRMGSSRFFHDLIKPIFAESSQPPTMP